MFHPTRLGAKLLLKTLACCQRCQNGQLATLFLSAMEHGAKLPTGAKLLLVATAHGTKLDHGLKPLMMTAMVHGTKLDHGLELMTTTVRLIGIITILAGRRTIGIFETINDPNRVMIMTTKKLRGSLTDGIPTKSDCHQEKKMILPNGMENQFS